MKGFSVILASIFFLFITGCEKGTESNKNDPGGKVEFQSDCKSFNINEDMSQSIFTAPDTQTCIHYSYDGEGRLELTHINAGFNCCPGDISAEIIINEQNITIEEHEESTDCDCNCLFDIKIVISDLEPATYHFTFVEPYLPENNKIIEFSLDLENESEGSICFDRHGYPWGE